MMSTFSKCRGLVVNVYNQDIEISSQRFHPASRLDFGSLCPWVKVTVCRIKIDFS